jgi:hypothetical protein
LRRLPIDSKISSKLQESRRNIRSPYADCFAVTTALKEKASIVSGDPEIKKVEKIAQIEWIQIRFPGAALFRVLHEESGRETGILASLPGFIWWLWL